MKIIDFHTHLMLPDVEAEVLIPEMDRNNVERALLLGVTPRYQRLYSKVGTNEQVAHLHEKYPERIIGGFEINPLDMAEAKESLERYAAAGFKVVKMFPYLGFYPDDKMVCPLYERIEELGLMVLYHMGGTLFSSDRNYALEPGISAKYGRPQFVDAPALRFPGIDFIMAHMGCPDCEEAAYMAANHPNVYLDCSSTFFRPAFKRLAANAEFLLRPVDFKKIFWGVDGYPAAYPRMIDGTRELMHELGWAEHVPDVFYNNARAMLARHQ